MVAVGLGWRSQWFRFWVFVFVCFFLQVLGGLQPTAVFVALGFRAGVLGVLFRWCLWVGVRRQQCVLWI